MKAILADREEAGNKLATKLSIYLNHPQAVVLGLPRGGIPVAYVIAKNLHLPLDVCLVKKLGLPSNQEVAFGAVAEDVLLPNYDGKITIIDPNTTQINKINQDQVKAIASLVKAELKWRDHCYRNFRPMIQITDRVVILVDDGIATGLTMNAAIKVLQKHKPQKIIIATPVASLSAIQELKPKVDEIVCLITPKNFNAVGFWYKDFKQITDQEVCDLLAQELDSNQAETAKILKQGS